THTPKAQASVWLRLCKRGTVHNKMQNQYRGSVQIYSLVFQIAFCVMDPASARRYGLAGSDALRRPATGYAQSLAPTKKQIEKHDKFNKAENYLNYTPFYSDHYNVLKLFESIRKCYRNR